MSFTLRFTLALVLGLAAAIVLAPVAAMAVAAGGWRFPFPRIFDRTMMATILLAMLWAGRGLHFGALLKAGFQHPAVKSTTLLLGGLAVSLGTIAVLFGLSIVTSRSRVAGFGAVAARLPKYFLSAIVIAVIEEGFFRAFMLGGMKRDFGARIALVLSSAIYAVTHLIRSPAHFYVTGYVPFAGLQTVAHSVDQLSNPAVAIPTVIGLFLLGIVLGEAFLLTGSVYMPIGLHCGFVLGAKLWPKVVLQRAAVPWWVAGGGPVPMIAAPAAWILSLLILFLLPLLIGTRKRQPEISP